MSQLYIANIAFEEELEGRHFISLEESMEVNPVYRRLQFLPLLFAKEEDFVAVTKKKNRDDSRLCLLSDEVEVDSVISWGHSRLVANWAKEKRLPYSMPDWEIVCEVNSKEFSHRNFSTLPGAKLVWSEEELPKKYPYLLKSRYGVASRGNYIIDGIKEPPVLKNFPLIMEPWVKRKIDFSTHWTITESGAIEYLGLTKIKNTPRGIFRACEVGEELVPSEFAEAQKEQAIEALKLIASMGYFGPVGIDAMVWGDDQLQAIVEINARMTMARVAILAGMKSLDFNAEI